MLPFSELYIAPVQLIYTNRSVIHSDFGVSRRKSFSNFASHYFKVAVLYKMSSAVGIGFCICRRRKEKKKEAKRQAEMDELRQQLNRAQCAVCQQPIGQCQCKPSAACGDSATTAATATANDDSSSRKDRKKKKKSKQ